jgi:hypothetical protein
MAAGLSSSLRARTAECARAIWKEEVTEMRNRATPLIIAVALGGLLPAAGHAQLTPYSQDFEGFTQSDPSALGNDGWLVYGNVFASNGTTYIYGYGPFPAPNDGFAFCQIDLGQGGAEQGFQQLVVFSDYNNADHAAGRIIESNVYREQTVGAGDVGHTWVFAFQAKLGNLVAPSTAAAFIKTLNPSAGYALTNLIVEDMTSIPATWSGYTLSITIDASLVGQLLQIGFLNKATLYVSSGVFYDNLDFHLDTSGVGAPPSSVAPGLSLRQNYPNPFNPSTRIGFALDRPSTVEIAVYDLAGRKVATLQRGELGIGEHVAMWDGRADNGAPVASGEYRYVLTTRSGRVSRSMVLLK